MPASETASLLVTRIVIERHIGLDGQDTVVAEFVDSDGDMPTLIEVLGMLELTKDTALRLAAGECDGDDDE